MKREDLSSLIKKAGSTLSLLSRHPEETLKLGMELGRHARPGDAFLLVGELGSGKTILAQGIARGLGIKEYASSPSFVIVKQYRGRLTLFHIDLYRLDDPSEIAALGLEDYLYSSGVVVMEWAEKARELWPSNYLLILLEYAEGESERRLTLVFQGRDYEERFRGVKWS